MNRIESDKEFAKMVRTTAIYTIGAAFVIWLLFGFIPLIFSEDSVSAGTFGDSFGFVNSLLSSLALAGAICAIVLQTRELRYQRDEIQESQETWKEQSIAMLLSSYIQTESELGIDTFDAEDGARRKTFYRSLSWMVATRLQRLQDESIDDQISLLQLMISDLTEWRDGEGDFNDLLALCQRSDVMLGQLASDFRLIGHQKEAITIQVRFVFVKNESEKQIQDPANVRKERIETNAEWLLSACVSLRDKMAGNS